MPSSSNSTTRRLIAVAVAGIAMLTMGAAPAAAADGGYATIDRAFKMSGDRDRLAVVAKFTRPAAGSGLALGVTLGNVETGSGSISVIFTQGTGTTRSRGIKVDGFSSSYQAVQGTNCSYEMRLLCERKSYDWVAGRAYKVMFVRGAKNAQGWLWTVRLRDQKTGKVTTLVSLRSPGRQLAPTGAAGLYTNPNDCSNITSVAGVVNKPSGAGSSVSWGAKQTYTSCEGAEMAAPIVDGSARLRIG